MNRIGTILNMSEENIMNFVLHYYLYYKFGKIK